MLWQVLHFYSTLSSFLNKRFVHMRARHGKTALSISHQMSVWHYQVIMPTSRYCMTFKTATLMHCILHQDCSTCLYDLVHFVNIDFNRSLRAATSSAATTVQTRTKLGNRAFSAAGRSVRNSLPPSLQLTDSHMGFHRHLKTYLFKHAFDC